MASASPLTGVILVDCARANASEGLAITAERCGYGQDIPAFQSALQSACTEMGIDIDELAELVPEEHPQRYIPSSLDVAPDTPAEL